MVNKVILVGNVGRDPEVRYLDSGVAKASFSLATSETYKDKSGQKVSQTEWHNIVVWRGQAEVIEKYVKKGDRLYIEGKIKSRDYTDKEGVKKYITEIVVDNFQMLGSPNRGNNQGTDAMTPDTAPENVEKPEDDLPF